MPAGLRKNYIALMPSLADTHDGVRLKWQYSHLEHCGAGCSSAAQYAVAPASPPKTHVPLAMVEMGYTWFQTELQAAVIQGIEEI